MAQASEHSGTTVFEPHGSLEGLSLYFDYIPHYLFRTYSPRSAGINTETVFASVAVKGRWDTSDILGRPQGEAVKMLEHHLSWKYYTGNNLVSWTNSFLFAVQHAIRREETDRPDSKADSIRISILDTRKVPRGTFLPAIALLVEYGIASEDKLQHDYYHGEYLSQGRLSSDAIATTTLEKLIKHDLYKLYPPFGDVSERKRLCLRVRQLRRTFQYPPEEPSDEELEIAQKIATGCFPNDTIRPVVMMTLLSLKPRCRSEPKILKVFKDNRWGTLMSDDSPEWDIAASEDVPEHKQFTEMMHDVHDYIQGEKGTERANGDAVASSKETSDLADILDQLSLTSDQSSSEQSDSDTSTMSERVYAEDTHQTDIQDVNTGFAIKETWPSSPKTRWIEMMEEEEEEQESALYQIYTRNEETRPCPECAGRISEICFRRDHFDWCTVHERMIYHEDMTCLSSPLDDDPPSVMRCTRVSCDKNEEEAYWAEVEKNAILGGAGFREPGEPHIH